MTKQKKEDQRDDAQAQADGEPSSPRFGLDFEEFAHFFEGEDITEEQARAFLKIYWEIACEIMSLGFGFHPVQQAQKACGRNGKTLEQRSFGSADKVYLTQELTSGDFEKAAAPAPERKGKESSHDGI